MRNDSLQEFIKLRRQLTEEKASIEKRLQQINQALGAIDSTPSGGSSGQAQQPQASPAKRAGGKRQMSPEARARIAEAQRRRWAERKGGNSAGGASQASSGNAKSSTNGKPKRKMSAAGRKAISEAAKRRWAAARAANA
jgi:hypothetical protein